MSSPDSVQDKAYEAANAISAQVGRLWMEAHAAGMRNGMEAGAVLLDGSMMWCRENDVDPLVVQLLEGLRDQLRLSALQVPDPKVPSIGGADE